MQQGKNTLKSIAHMAIKNKPTPKKLREVELQELAEWLLWAEIAKEHSNKELVTAEFEADLLGIIKNQFTELPNTQIAMARLMVKYSVLMANEKYLTHSLIKIYQKVNALEKIEKQTNKGGRKKNIEIYEIANLECISWFNKKNKKPTGGELVRLVDAAMIAKKGSSLKNGNSYISEKSARNFVREWQPPIKLNRQELVNSFSN